MYLVDTSVWLDCIKGNPTDHVNFLDNLLQNPLAATNKPLNFILIAAVKVLLCVLV